MRLSPELFQFDKDPNEPLYADHLYAQHKAVYSAMQRENAVDTYFTTLQKGAATAMEEDKSAIVHEEMTALYELIQSTMETDPEEAASDLQILDTVEQEVSAQMDDPLFIYKELTAALSGDPDIPPELVEYEAEQLLYSYILSDALSKDWTGTALDIAGLIIKPNISFISNRITEGEGGWWRSASNLEKMSTAFRTMPVEDRIPTFLALVQEVKDNTPNSMKAMSIINGIVNEEGYERIATDHLLDKIGLIGWVADAATLGVMAGRKLAAPVAMLGRIRNEKTATDLIESALRSPEVRQTMGVDQVDVAAHISPTMMDDALFNGMPSATRMETARRMAAIQEATGGMEGRVLMEGMESLVDASAAEARAARTIIATEDGQAVTNIRVVDAGPRGLRLQYEVVTPDSPSLIPDIGPNAPDWQREALRLAEQTGDSWRSIATQVGKPKSTVSDFLRRNYYTRQELQGPPIPAMRTKTVEVPYTRDDISSAGFNTDVHSLRIPLIHHLASPAYKFQAESEALKNVMQRGMFQSGKWRNMFNTEYSKIWHMAPMEQRRKVGSALERGNIDGKVFSYTELRGMGLDDAGASQYFAFRELMDQAWLLKNKELADMHIASGHHMFNIGNRPTPVRVYDNALSAEDSVRQAGATNVLVFDDTATQGQRLNLRATTDGTISPKLKEYMDNGYVLLRPQTEMGVYEHMGEGYRFILARKTETKPIARGDKLIDYHEGYIPIFYGPEGKANYFGQMSRYSMVDGAVTEVGRSTKVYFSNLTDAQEWERVNNLRHFREKMGMSEQEAATALANAKANKTALPFSVKHDREIRQHEFDTWYAGGPYTGHRSSERLRRGLQEDSAEYLDPFYSMQRYLDNIANHMPLAAYRIGLEDKWMKHARAHNAIPNDFAGGFLEAKARVASMDTRTVGADVQRFLIDSHNHITFNNRVATLGEQHARGWAVTFAERLENIIGKDSKAVTFMHRLEQKSLPDMIRATSFHSLLGVFSPAQFVVQGSGASVALSLHPVNAAKGLPYSLGIAAIDNVRDAGQKAALLQRLEKSYPGMVERYRAWEKTGLHDAIVATSADYRAAISSHPIGTDMYSRVVGEGAKAVDKSAFFYKAGELVNRRISFSTAVEGHLARGGKLDDAGIKLVMNDANKFMLNMDRAVKADFQKGWWGVPTQFLQVHTKFMETLVGKTLTNTEKSRLLALQLAMFGGLGVPFGTGVIGYGLSKFNEPGELSPEVVQLARQGMSGFLLSEVFGLNNEIATRTAIPNGVSETFTNMFIDNPGLWNTLVGASGSLPERIFEFGGVMHSMLHANRESVAQMDSTDLKLAGQALLEIVSSGRSMVAAYQMFHNDVIYGDRGAILFTDDYTIREKIARGAGFQLSEVADMRQEFQTKRNIEMRVNEYVSMLSDYMARRWNINNGISDADSDKFEALFQGMMAVESPGMQERVRRGFETRMFSGETMVDKSNREFAERLLNDLRHRLDVLSRQYPRGEE